ncbi:sugar phosphate isomerase/epimerase family protein [Tepidibacter aestuarii]|uniref:sugar phosphate isomerase/epimerase family protein n=1 Tax=Tepidibacter aestuarii TaxID=2925782 RepID=UPI0020BFF738|nr:TIM barrel protein [Tepidibacter aestuarii]CAH2212300.1 Sugar phosphate isomerase/epimerase [Tepidibacter aestuarii]
MAYEIKEKIKLCQKLRLNHIEVGIDNLEDWNYLYQTKDEFTKNNISIGIHMPMELNTCDPIKKASEFWLDYFYENYKIGKEFNVKYYNLHLGYGLKNKVEKNRIEYLNNTVNFLSKLLNNIEDTDIYIENTYSKNGDLINLGNKVSDFEYLFENVTKYSLGFCYDIGHNLINKDDYLSRLSNNIRLIHLSDNDGNEDLHLGLSENGLLTKKDIKDVLEINNNEYLVFEMNTKYINESIKFIQTIQKNI